MQEEQLKNVKLLSRLNYVLSLTIQYNIKTSWGKINAIQGKKISNQIHFLQAESNNINSDSKEMGDSHACNFVVDSGSKNYTDVFQHFKNDEENREENVSNEET